MKQSERENYRALLLERRAAVSGDVDGLENEAKSSGVEVRMPTHMADLGTDASVLEDSMGQIVSLGGELRQIDDALHRIENGTYGTCTACGNHISPERLKALPFAELCIHCKQAQENGQ